MRFISSIIALLCLLILPACAADSFTVYLPASQSKRLLVFNGTVIGNGLKLEAGRHVALGFSGKTITKHPTKPVLYVASARTEGKDATPGVTIFLDKYGEYVRKQGVKLAHGYAYLHTDRTGRFLLGANYPQGHVDVYALQGDGVIGKTVERVDAGRATAHCVLPSLDNRFVYIPYVKTQNALYQYGFDASTGKLKALAPRNAKPPEGTGPRHMAYHPTLPIAYFSNEQHVGVSVYMRKPSGQLEIKQVCDAIPSTMDKKGLSASDIWITPDGRYVFTGLRGKRRDFDHISRYKVLEDGSLKHLGLTPADDVPWGMFVTGDGKFLLVTAARAGTLTAFRIGDDGSLTKVASVKTEPGITDVWAVVR